LRGGRREFSDSDFHGTYPYRDLRRATDLPGGACHRLGAWPAQTPLTGVSSGVTVMGKEYYHAGWGQDTAPPRKRRALFEQFAPAEIGGAIWTRSPGEHGACGLVRLGSGHKKFRGLGETAWIHWLCKPIFDGPASGPVGNRAFAWGLFGSNGKKKKKKRKKNNPRARPAMSADFLFFFPGAIWARPSLCRFCPAGRDGEGRRTKCGDIPRTRAATGARNYLKERSFSPDPARPLEVKLVSVGPGNG